MLPQNPVEQLLTVFDSQADIAAFCLVSRMAVSHWKEAGRIPVDHIPELSRFTGIAPWSLAPDAFPCLEET